MKCCDIESGKLRHKVSVQRLNRIDAGGGSYNVEWETFASPYAWIKPLSGTESLFGMQLEDTITHDIIIRYKASRTITPENRIKFGSRLFNIRSVINVEERNRWLQIRAEEGVAQ